MIRETNLIDLRPNAECRENFRLDVLLGLRESPKRVPSKYLYDHKGSELFERICDLPEYYPTRSEIGILRRHGKPIAERLGEGVILIEFGSGSSVKTRLVLDQLKKPDAYIPIDISKTFLLETAERVASDYFGIPVIPVCADYTRFLFPLREVLDDHPNRVAFFPGSTIGNFDPPEAIEFLANCAAFLDHGGKMLLGADLIKDTEVLEAAYNDAQGVTARFNLNLLERMNRELSADFDPSRFRHHAFYNAEMQRIEMHLISLEDQKTRIDGEYVLFRSGESIHTENSYKYTLAGLERMARDGGFGVREIWTDERNYFCVALLEVVERQFPSTRERQFPMNVTSR